jgi:hypothetical protein
MIIAWASIPQALSFYTRTTYPGDARKSYTGSAMMPQVKRRGFFKTFAALPAANALIAQTPSANQQTTRQAPAAGRSNIPSFEETAPEAVADSQTGFFTPAQFAALRRLSALFMPPLSGNPGAVECQTAEFLDFLIGVSPADRQKLYRDGLELLNSKANQRFQKSFADLEDAQADATVRPFLTPIAWEYDLPTEPGQHFIAQARRDIRTATQNSREWAMAAEASGRRRFGGGGTYILPIDPIYRSN